MQINDEPKGSQLFVCLFSCEIAGLLFNELIAGFVILSINAIIINQPLLNLLIFLLRCITPFPKRPEIRDKTKLLHAISSHNGFETLVSYRF